jgi:repressor LexA
MLKVKGDSMIDAGIMEGDMVLVERGKTPKPGQIVIAAVDGEYTMKYYRIKDGVIFLEPANPNFKPIYPTGELRVEAIVQAVIRKY